ncbi:hypothetical protein E1B28_008568 [Marasmius oreades]|uniref:Zn(2)-C6 fungal-type domain-containing protein n=1 Tax=Marasmius oreades TaxID=181124 RepID=A0A9P7RZB4_9AGAR|nr:uncharacterized protein E1B28_008568 [Marasmius oreades]KAG7092200.1 hypothetical protein E1B28_008568 [Marasmius oreades]
MDQPLPPSEQLTDMKLSTKPPVVRGARACTTCRAAKMKCVGSEDGQKQCQRCKRAGVECVFEKHRRGRKPGSKLSEASKMLRRLEKGLSTAKLKSQTSETSPSFVDGRILPQDRYVSHDDACPTTGTHFPSNQLPPLTFPPYGHAPDYPSSSTSSRTAEMDEDEDSGRTDDNIFPAKLIRRENRRHSFFRTILNPEESPAPGPSSARSTSPLSQSNVPERGSSDIPDPVSIGLMDEDQAKVLFDLIFLRLNPFINLFDPSLHSAPYVRKKSPFLFTVLLMAGCKFFRPDLFKNCQKLANDLAVRAFLEAWKSVEVVQAFACLTYWRDPDDNRTWTYIGYACRMAVELDLNRYVAHPPPHETDLQFRERRNRERTYLILFVHDRSLSTSTGRNWMLPEDEFIRHATNWHEHGVEGIRPEDVIVCAFVQLRHIAAETTETFRNSLGGHSDINHEVVLRNCNGQLTMWMETWEQHMRRAAGEAFHFSFLSLFRLYIRIFTNSFGVKDIFATNRNNLSACVQALSICYTSAIDVLKILSKDFKSMSILRYGQDTVTMMSAYAAVFLLNNLRNPVTGPQLPGDAAHQIHSVITKTADAFEEASAMSPACSSAAYHARFLRNLIANDLFRSRKLERYPVGSSLDPRLQGENLALVVSGCHTAQSLPGGPTSMQQSPIYSHPSEPSFHFPSSHPSSHVISHDSDYGTIPNRSNGSLPPPHSAVAAQEYSPISPQAPQHASKHDEEYWKSMLMEIGFGGHADPLGAAGMSDEIRPYHDGRHHHTLPPPMNTAPSQGYGH